jgi:hypothetical protein
VEQPPLAFTQVLRISSVPSVVSAIARTEVNRSTRTRRPISATRAPRGKVEGGRHGRWIVIDNDPDLPDVTERGVAEAQRQRCGCGIGRICRRFQAHVILIQQADAAAGVELPLQIFPGTAGRRLAVADSQ